jgi:hypothetical protein
MEACMKTKFFLLAFLLTACATTNSSAAQTQPPLFKFSGLPITFAVENGWLNGQTVSYYNLGMNTPLQADDPTRVAIQPVWVFVTGVAADGTPNKLPGQDSILDVTLGDAAYTDLWQAHFVSPSPDYKPNSITSADVLNKSQLKIAKQAMFVNCPFVPAGSSLADKSLELVKGWVKGQQVFYFDFGVTSAVPGKVYIFVTGFDANQQPQYVKGQHVLFDSKKGGAGYSDFRLVQWVIVDSTYQADSIKSVSDIKYKIESTKIVVNYPQK